MTQLSEDAKPLVCNIMIWNAARGGMRSVVEAYARDGLLESERLELIASYCDGSFIKRQLVLLHALQLFLRRLLTRRIGFVHIHVAMRGSFLRKSLFAMLARGFRVPVILHLHGSEMKPFYASLPPWGQRMVVGQLESADRVLVLSESWKTFIAGIAPGAHVIVVPNYVTIPPQPLPHDRTPARILFLGLVGNRKGVFDLLPAMKRIAQAHPAAHLVIGGNGETDRAAQMIAELGLQHAVTLAGWIDGPEKARLLAEADIYVLPSYNEGLPMSVLEAMAEGLAVVTTRVGGIPELIADGEHGLLINPGDVDALADAVIRLISDKGLRDRIAAAGQRRVEAKYSDRAVLPQLRSIYAAVDRGPRQGGASDRRSAPQATGKVDQ